jgi:Tetracyclin repressor-like, C-terminal domain
MDLLEAARRYQAGPLALESILDAFVRPTFEVTMGVSLETSDVTREIVRRAFDDTDLIFIAELGRALPDLSEEDIQWRFHFLVGAMLYTISDSGQLEGLSGGRCLPRQLDIALANLALTFSSLFRAPALVAQGPTKLGHRGADAVEQALGTRLAAPSVIGRRMALRGLLVPQLIALACPPVASVLTGLTTLLRWPAASEMVASEGFVLIGLTASAAAPFPSSRRGS